jgi:hypothetical protein
MLERYIGKSRRGAGLKRGEFYEVLDSTWRTMLKVRTDTGAETFVPVHCFEHEPAMAVPRPGIHFNRCRSSTPEARSIHLDRGRKGLEIRGFGVHITLIHS